ncbi:hypothetical protein NAEGRDRAFT_65056 [Naegleria gruberi]|uniref:F-box domain-containing protein n=1 Tax=Naegleria gruberi TaxID=5762 RepID=D2V876_NAEGR|nr:uncharacterized protein NAEGRDRAFT_65056 [Naegleria gruberi]EFC46996.1 hypothetical protein NAEGRDRAFT_65056 [Naegleria gruberi]|eukprot:XP_002679740.1 hypothetical protein NAEGRDRAFT_65056 [Naegleria gruberi strain NEG-M]
MSTHGGELYHQLPSEIIMEILSYLEFEAKLCSGKSSTFFKYYFGRFRTGNICFLFKNLCWDQTRVEESFERQVINIELCANDGKRIDLIEGEKSNILKPNLQKHNTEEKVIENLERTFKNVDTDLVKSIHLSSDDLPEYVSQWALKKFTSSENINIRCDYYSNSDYGLSSLASLIAKCRNLKKLTLDCIDSSSLIEHFIEISKNTPQLEYFKNKSLTSIFTAPEIFENWKNIKEIYSVIYLIRGEITEDPTSEQVVESFAAINKLKYLEKMVLTTLRLSLSYAEFSDYLMDSISKNSQLKELSFENGGYRENLTRLTPETFKQLETFKMFSITNELAEHFSKFESIKKLSIKYAEIDQFGLESLLKLPKLEKVIYSKGFNALEFDLPQNGKIVFEKLKS